MRKAILLSIGVLLSFTVIACGSGNNDSSQNPGQIKLDPDVCAKVSICVGNQLPIDFVCTAIEAYKNNLYGINKNFDDTEIKYMQAAVAALVKNQDDCEKIKNTMFATQEELSKCKGDIAGYCDGDMVIKCHSKTHFNCADAGLKCIQTASYARCAEASCDQKGIKCINKDTAIICNEGIEKHVYCPVDVEVSKTYVHGSNNDTTELAMGGVCNPSAESSENACIGTGKECDPIKKYAHCNGDHLITCKNGKLADVDCTSLNLKCFDKGNGKAFCGVADECDPFNSKASCEDNKIKYCMLGKWDIVDCAAFGGHCAQDKEMFNTWYCAADNAN